MPAPARVRPKRLPARKSNGVRLTGGTGFKAVVLTTAFRFELEEGHPVEPLVLRRC